MEPANMEVAFQKTNMWLKLQHQTNTVTEILFAKNGYLATNNQRNLQN